MGEIEKLLAELKAEYREPEKPLPNVRPSPETDIDRLLARVKADFSSSPRREPISPAPPEVQEQKPSEAIHPQPVEPLRQQQKPSEAIHPQPVEPLGQQRKQAARQKQAQKWLDSLDPKSDEGKWFEEFSYTHPSRLEAAMIYLDALRDVNA